MDRVTLRLPTELLEDVEEMVEDRGYPNRCEVIREAIRDHLYPREETPEPFEKRGGRPEHNWPKRRPTRADGGRGDRR